MSVQRDHQAVAVAEYMRIEQGREDTVFTGRHAGKPVLSGSLCSLPPGTGAEKFKISAPASIADSLSSGFENWRVRGFKGEFQALSSKQ